MGELGGPRRVHRIGRHRTWTDEPQRGRRGGRGGGGRGRGSVASLAAVVYAAVATGGIAVLGHGMPSNVGWFAACLLGAWCGLIGGRRDGLVYCAAALALFGVEWLWFHPDPGWGAWMAGVTFSVLAALLIRHEIDLVSQLRAARVGLAERATAEERSRIARELHDVIAHTLTVSLLHVTSARLAVEHDPADAARALAEAERLGRESLAEVRSSVGILHQDEGVARTAPLPGVDGLPALVERFRSAGADVTLTVDGDPGRLPVTTGLAVYRILQEALTNAIKHAPGSPTAARLSVAADAVELAVDSAAEPGTGTGLGVLIMRERAELLGGSCEAGPGGRGWLVRATLPLAASRGREGAT
jgi:signal transduction histidine kinase